MADKPKAVAVAPFTVEASHPRNCDILVQSLNGVISQRLRSTIRATTKTVPDSKEGRTVVRTHTTRGQSIPDLPGMRLEVNPGELTVRVFDPLADDEQAREELNRYLKTVTGVRQNTGAVKEAKGEMDQHRMKTLCREILQGIKADDYVWVDGPKFDQEDCDALPGDYLLNPGARIPNNQPAFEKDLPAYQEQLLKAGQ